MATSAHLFFGSFPPSPVHKLIRIKNIKIKREKKKEKRADTHCFSPIFSVSVVQVNSFGPVMIHHCIPHTYTHTQG
jgi:hypothetical protein